MAPTPRRLQPAHRDESARTRREDLIPGLPVKKRRRWSRSERQYRKMLRGPADRPSPLWPIATVLGSVLALTLVGTAVGFSAAQVDSIFVGHQSELIGSGWAKCEEPITWSADTSRMPLDESIEAVRDLTSVFDQWSAASGLTFKYAGEVPVSYDDATFGVSSTIHPSDRHIYLAFLNDKESTFLDVNTVGFATPTKVLASEQEIIEGTVAFSIDYLEGVTKKRQLALYLHELGHALGLGHGTSEKNAMYYMVDTTGKLSAGDSEGIRAIVKPCSK